MEWLGFGPHGSYRQRRPCNAGSSKHGQGCCERVLVLLPGRAHEIRLQQTELAVLSLVGLALMPVHRLQAPPLPPQRPARACTLPCARASQPPGTPGRSKTAAAFCSRNSGAAGPLSCHTQRSACPAGRHRLPRLYLRRCGRCCLHPGLRCCCCCWRCCCWRCRRCVLPHLQRRQRRQCRQPGRQQQQQHRQQRQPCTPPQSDPLHA